MEKIKLEIAGLSYSQTQSGAYALVLAETKGKRRLPIIIGGFEAQAIAIELEKMNLGQKIDYGTLRDNSEVTAPDYELRVRHCRVKVRAEQWLNPTQRSSLWTLEGKKAHKKTLDLVSVCQESRTLFLDNIVQTKSFICAPNPDFSHFREYLEAGNK